MKPGLYYSLKFDGIIEVTQNGGYYGIVNDNDKWRWVISTSWGEHDLEIESRVTAFKHGYKPIYLGKVE